VSATGIQSAARSIDHKRFRMGVAPHADARVMRARMPGAFGECREKAPARAADDQEPMIGRCIFGFWEFRAPGTMCTGRGTRASANTSGSDFTQTRTAGEIADPKIRTERRKTVSSAGPVFDGSKPFETTIRPFDLMSRRHPLSSTRAARPHQLGKANRPERLS